MFLSEVMIENFRQFGRLEPSFTLELQPGVTALVGENDTGKTAVVDAIRYALLTREVDYIRVSPDDFHIDSAGVAATDIVIRCKLSDLSEIERGAFAEYLTYEDNNAVLYVYWRARRVGTKTSRRVADVSVHSGSDGTGPTLDPQVRQLLAAAYLRPLRDAEREMSPGQGSRLSQILGSYPGIDAGEVFDTTNPPVGLDEAKKLSLVAMTDYHRHLVNQHGAVTAAQGSINERYLSQLVLAGESLEGRVSFTEGGSETARLRQVLERLQLNLLDGVAQTARGRYGLGSNNLLYMACELLLLGKDPEGLPLLLIEEPEAHLHPQRQLRLMDFLLSAAGSNIPGSRSVQVLVTTHSPNLSSRIPLKNLVLLGKQRAYPLAEGQTKLARSDYRFLERFLDSTKANLFFARGIIIVEGDAEAIVVPYLASALDRDLTTHGVSIVNVGSTGLRRYARILQRENPSMGEPNIPVACMADQDVMPSCAPQILGYVNGDNDAAWTNLRRKWRARHELTPESLAARRTRLQDGDGGGVKTFISDKWTFEYDLAAAGLAEEIYIAGVLALNDDPLNEDKKAREVVEAEAMAGFAELRSATGSDIEALCSHAYEIYARRQGAKASKAVAAQYLVELLETRSKEDQVYRESLPAKIPAYVRSAIVHATTQQFSVSENTDATQ